MIVISEGAFWTIIMFMINATIGVCISMFMWNLLRNPVTKKHVNQAVTDGDDIVHTQDARNTLAMFWGVIFIWLSVNIYGGGLIYEHQYIALGAATFTCGCVLLAIKKFSL